jgi:hypothetical protein
MLALFAALSGAMNTGSLAENNFQDPQVSLGHRNAGTASECVITWDKLEEPLFALIVHHDFVIGADRIGRGVAGNSQRVQQRIQEQGHITKRVEDRVL